MTTTFTTSEREMLIAAVAEQLDFWRDEKTRTVDSDHLALATNAHTSWAQLLSKLASSCGCLAEVDLDSDGRTTCHSCGAEVTP